MKLPLKGDLTIVMYHYVTDRRRSRWPQMNVLDLEDFDVQLDYLEKTFDIIGQPDLIAAAVEGTPLPRRACLLTFDDGLLDHYVNVFPRLRARGLPGAFYPSVNACDLEQVLPVHKIQLILACSSDKRELSRIMFREIDALRDSFPIPSAEALTRHYGGTDPYDTPEVYLLKMLLQHGLPEAARQTVVNRLFCTVLGDAEPVIARALYVDRHQLRTMASAGMAIGGHGATHSWIGELAEAEQRTEIARSRDLIRDVSGDQSSVPWAMCYPSNSYNETTLAVLREAGCAIGLTCNPGTTSGVVNPLTLPRLDTNELPPKRSAGA